jgi:hypothetical protein
LHTEADDFPLQGKVRLEDIVFQGWVVDSSLYFAPLKERHAALLQALDAPSTATSEAVTDAAMFLDLLPVDVPEPAIVVEEDGQIGLDWRVGTKSLSLNLGRGGMIGYASLFGTETAYGCAAFSATDIPSRIASLLHGLVEEREGR